MPSISSVARFISLIVLVALARAADYDLVVRNARVVDGTGNPWFVADVGVRAGRIAAIGDLARASSDRVIDARRRILAPGFIDVHTHVESGIEKAPRGDNYLMDGVTTVVTGNCGGSRGNLGEWFAQLEKTGIGLNLASLAGHNTVRRSVMGAVNRFATAEEIARMQEAVEKAMLDGAVGFSTGLIYIPGTYSNTEEVVALAKAAAKHGGVYASHMRDEGERISEAITEAVTVGKEAGMPVQISHFKIDNRRLWGKSTDSIALVEKFRREGVDVVVDQYPYDHSSTNIGITLPSWALADGNEAVRERLRSPETRARVKGEMAALLAAKGHPDYSYAIVANHEPDRSIEGKNISEINLLRGRSKSVENETETILEILDKGGAGMVYHSMSMEDM